MATVRISDTIVPEIFHSYMVRDTMQKMAFYDTGVFRSDANLSSLLSGGGTTFNLPFWKDLDDDEADTASDDPNSYAVPGKIGSGKDIARRHIRTKAWSAAQLAAELAGSDPMDRIKTRVSAYWARQFDDVQIATIRGVVADNIANDGSDMVESIATDGAGAITSAELISAEAIMDAAQTMGDQKSSLGTIVMHSEVENRLAKLDLISFRPDSTGTVMVKHYLDYRVVVSDKVPAIAGTNRVTYHNYLLGTDLFGWAETNVARPVAVENDELAGDGMGVETLVTRRQFGLHPYGIKWTEASVAGHFPNNAELRMADNWDRVYPERKQIPMAVLLTNG